MSEAHSELMYLRTGQTFVPQGYDLFVRQQREFVQENPFPSPDGRWLLYREMYVGKPDRDARVDAPVRGQEPERFRLAGLRETIERLIPSSERFELPHIDHVAWLPDSRGWIVLRASPLTLTRHRLSAPSAPEPMPVPRNLPYRSVKYRDNFIAQITTLGELVIDDGADGLYFALLASGGTVRFVRLKSPPNVVRDLQGTRIARLSPSGRSLIVCAREGVRWVFWRLFTDGGRSRRLFSVPRKVFEFELSPDGKSLIFWQWNDDSVDSLARAYQVTLN